MYKRQEQLVFIAALNISYELAQEKAKTRDYAASMEQRIRMLQQTIEQALLEQGRITEKTNQNFEWHFSVYCGRVTVKTKFLWDVRKRASPLSRYFIPQECGAPRLVSMLGPSEKP